MRWRSVFRPSLPCQWMLLPLRLVMGAGFLVHGLAKLSRGPAKFGALLNQIGAPLPVQTAWAVTGLEIVGGTLLIVGLWVTLACLPLAGSMVVALLTVHIHYGFSSVNTVGLTPSGPVFGPPGYEINLLYIAGLLALATTGPTTLSLDRWLCGTSCKA